jgi:hypothetical protein
MRKRDVCGPRPGGFGELTSLADICQAYVEYRRCCCDDKEWYEQQPTLAGAIAKAAMARRASGKVAPDASGRRCSHHTRKPAVLLGEATRRLLDRESVIATMRDFDALIEFVEGTVDDLKGLGPLYTYDTALRIGYKLRILPERVYLHAGTCVGAAALGLDVKRGSIPRDEFPPPLSSFDGAAIEDILCIYRDRFATLRP